MELCYQPSLFSQYFINQSRAPDERLATAGRVSKMVLNMYIMKDVLTQNQNSQFHGR